MSYCKRCNGYSAEVGKPNDDGLCDPCAEVERLRAERDAYHEALTTIAIGYTKTPVALAQRVLAASGKQA